MILDKENHNFLLYKEYISYSTSSTFFIRLEPKIKNKEELLNFLYYALWFPGYFGLNWDALWDCITDLSWIPFKKVVIEHTKIPEIEESDKKKYVKMLYDAINLPPYEGCPSIEVLFPEHERNVLEDIITTA